MRTAQILVIVTAGIGGLAAGFGFQRLRPEPEASAPPPALSSPAIVQPKSTDTVETLLGLDGAALDERLTLWLLDASSADIGNLWSAWRKRGALDTWQMNLVFARWLKLDPESATSAAGTEGSSTLEWARAVLDPEASLARIKGLPEKEAVAAMAALGDFHPESAMKAFASKPELATQDAVRRVAIRLADRDPESALNFMRLYQAGCLPSVMRVWTRNDPDAALAWLKAQPNDGPGDPYLDDFIGTLVNADLPRLAAFALTLPQGRIRREMERAVFFKTLESDLDAAILRARANEAPRIAAEWFAEIGRRQMGTHADRAFETFGEMLAACPDCMHTFDRVAGADGFGSVVVELRGVKDFAGALLDRNPKRTLDLALATHRKSPGMQSNPWYGALGRLGDAWSERDLNGFTKWLEEHPEGPVHDGGAGLIAWTYAHRQDFPTAIRWAQGIGEEDKRGSRIDEVSSQWAKHDRDALAEWLKTADLPDAIRSKVNQYLEENPQ